MRGREMAAGPGLVGLAKRSGGGVVPPGAGMVWVVTEPASMQYRNTPNAVDGARWEWRVS